MFNIPPQELFDHELHLAKHRIFSLEKIKERFPDVQHSGSVLYSESLNPNDCDSVVYDKDTKSLRVCIWIDHMAICSSACLRVERMSSSPHTESRKKLADAIIACKSR